MQLFYTTNIQDSIATFGAEETRHLTVLRKKVEDRVYFIDGKGGRYVGEIMSISKKEVVAKVIEFEQAQVPAWQVHIAIAPTKNIARFEWFLEKATEIGISRISPIWCEHSERTKIRLDRLEKLLLSATKQSLRSFLPQLSPPQKFVDFIKQPTTFNAQRFIAHCADYKKMDLAKNYQAQQNVLILIGPEGDFSNKEIDLAEESGFQGVSLGNTRLRTETAGIVACHTISLLNQIGN